MYVCSGSVGAPSVLHVSHEVLEVWSVAPVAVVVTEGTALASIGSFSLQSLATSYSVFRLSARCLLPGCRCWKSLFTVDP